MSRSLKAFNKHLTLLPLPLHLRSSSAHPFITSSSFPLFPHHVSFPRFSFSHLRPLSSSAPATLMEVVKAIARQEPAVHENVAIRADQKSYSYKELLSSAQQISNLLCAASDALEGNLGGARIGIVAKPSAEFVAGIIGIWLSGGVAVPLATSYPEVELLYVIDNSDISAILSTEEHNELMQSVANKSSSKFFRLPSVVNISSEKSRNGHSQNGKIQEDRIFLDDIIGGSSEDDPALILYTSGTTGKPKGVVHTHRSIISQVQTLAKSWEYTSADKFLHCLPLHHVHGLFNGLMAPLYAGSSVEFLPKFSVRGVWQRWRESYPTDGSKADDAITVFTGVPTIYARLIQGYNAMDSELKHVSASAANNLRLMMCGSSALPLPVMQEWEAITGHRLLERYGMTEFVMALSNPLKGERKPGTVGKPFPGIEVKIIAEEDGEDDNTAMGELCVKSPSLFKEYYKLPEVTKESFTDDGFFKTGDAVTTDEDGYYIILGRTNADIIKAGGYKLSALEIESVIIEHPAILECCILGLPDNDYGEIVGAIVVLHPDVKEKRDQESKPALSLEELSTWAKDKIAPYKIPTKLILWEKLPRNAMGKINKKELKKLVVSEH